MGYEQLVFSRPRLYDLLQSRIPAHKISHNKKVLRIAEKGDKIQICCSDNTQYEGDILVGADGTYSGVRQSLYKQLEKQGVLPQEDTTDFTIGAVVMVAIAEPSDPEKFPQLKDKVCHFSNLIEGTGGRVVSTPSHSRFIVVRPCRNIYSPQLIVCYGTRKSQTQTSVASLPGNQICWAVAQELSEDEVEEARQFRNSHWEPMSIENMYKDFENMPCPWGGTMGEIMKMTPKDRISKVYPEKKLFKTWHHGRTVLIGDGKGGVI